MSQFLNQIESHVDCFNALKNLEPAILKAGELLSETICNKKKILVCGNGGSAADSQHFAAELVGRFEKERDAWPAVALTTDTSILTAIANDYAYDDVFARQVKGLGAKGDALIGISTSGNSENVLRAVKAAGRMDMKTIGLLGNKGGAIKDAVDCPVISPGDSTARIQEAHIFMLHFWARIIEHKMTSKLPVHGIETTDVL